ncbi:flagellar basal-body MS-ring/collar protein FliF [Candidatus Latescibacterota bacterium]
MFEMIQQVVARLRNVWDTMTLNQKVISGGMLIAVVVTFAYLTTFSSNFINYTVLFTELDPQSASEIATRLEQQNIPYRLSRDGRTIEVPENRATRLKIDMTAEGLPESGITGFEILDTTTFGMSDRIQEVQIQRALQGELARTLMTLEVVESANVTLSIPEPTLFTESEQPTTAAVILRLHRPGALTQKQVEGITHLISSAVPGLMPGNVTILDTQGNTLTRIYQDESAMLSSTQWEMKTQIDRYLANEAKRMLDGAFGAGKSLVTVNAELDWDMLERMTTSYSQDDSAIRSEERSTSTEPGLDGLSEQENSIVNYETGQIIENFAKNTGDIERLTVSVFVDHYDSTFTDDEGNTQIVKVPLSVAELASIRSITENAVGFSAERGDQLEVIQTPFTAVEHPAAESGMTIQAAIVESVRAIVLVVAILAAIGMFFLIVRSLASSLDPSKISMKTEDQLRTRPTLYGEDEAIPESDRDVLVRKIIKTSSENPEIAAKTLKTFFRE